MEAPNRLYSKEQIEEWASKRADDAGRLSRQLLDVMRREEFLEKTIEELRSKLDNIHMALHPNKHTSPRQDNGYNTLDEAERGGYPTKASDDWKCNHGFPHKQCGSCYDQKEPPKRPSLTD